MRDKAPRRIHVLAGRLAIAGILLGLWEYLPESALDSFLWSRPSVIGAQFLAWSLDGTLLLNGYATLRTVILGLLIGAAAGLCAGIAAGLSPAIARFADGPLQVLFALPKITLVPLFILWLGVGARQHVVFTALVVFFFFYFSIFNGIRQLPPALGNLFALLGAGLPRRIWHLLLPSSLRWIALSLRLAVPYAFVAAVSTEVIASTEGLGNLVKGSASSMDAAGMFAAMLALLAISLICSFLINRAAAQLSADV
jgi:NitT/TauT family transport system permease protein